MYGTTLAVCTDSPVIFSTHRNSASNDAIPQLDLDLPSCATVFVLTGFIKPEAKSTMELPVSNHKTDG